MSRTRAGKAIALLQFAAVSHLRRERLPLFSSRWKVACTAYGWTPCLQAQSVNRCRCTMYVCMYVCCNSA